MSDDFEKLEMPDTMPYKPSLSSSPEPNNSGHTYTYDAEGRAASVDGVPCYDPLPPAPIPDFLKRQTGELPPAPMPEWRDDGREGSREGAEEDPELIPTTGDLGVIIAWYQSLPKRAREGLSLANLHTLSKSLKTSRAALSAPIPVGERQRVEAFVTHAETKAAANGSLVFCSGKTLKASDLRALLSKVAELEGERDALKALVYAPGEMRCAKCKFVLYRRTLHVHSGNVSAGTSETEPCPNGCGPLWPITWKEACLSTGEAAETAFTEKEAAETALNTAKEENGRYELAVIECRDAVAFFDKVKVATADEKMAVGQDHWNRLEAAIRVVAALSTDGGGE